MNGGSICCEGPNSALPTGTEEILMDRCSLFDNILLPTSPFVEGEWFQCDERERVASVFAAMLLSL